MNNLVTIESCEYVAMQDGEEPGMPSFKIKGAIGGMKIAGVVSIELYGRDVDWAGKPHLKTMYLMKDDVLTDICDLIQKQPCWEEAVAIHDAQ